MTRPTIELATPDDDAAIRALLARNPVPGRITLSYLREPDYFAGCTTMGPFHQVLVARERGQVIGLACRAVRPMFINGAIEPVGYLGQLRVDRLHRGRWFVSRGFRLLRQLHDDGRASAYVTTIVEKNAEAAGVLVDRSRGDMPRYRFVDRLHTLALVPRRGRRRTAAATAARREDAPAIAGFLRAHGGRRQFFPAIDHADLGTPLLRGLAIEDFFIVRDGKGLRGVCALWDQSSYKQTVVNGYAPALAAMRPFYNAGARLLRRPSLPPAGSPLRLVYASLLCTAGDAEDVLTALLDALLSAAASRGHDYVVAAFAERDPHLAAAKTYDHVAYRSDIYTVQWSEGADLHDRLDGRPAYLDPAVL